MTESRVLLGAVIVVALVVGVMWAVDYADEQQRESEDVSAEIEGQALRLFSQSVPPANWRGRQLRDSAQAAWERRDFKRMHELIDGPMDSAYIATTIDIMRSHIEEDDASPRERRLLRLPRPVLRDSILAERKERIANMRP